MNMISMAKAIEESKDSRTRRIEVVLCSNECCGPFDCYVTGLYILDSL